MGLKAIITSEEYAKLPEGHQALYVEHGEGHRLDVEASEGWALDDLEGLRTTLGKLKREKTALKAQVQAAEGLDLDEARAALAKLAELEASGGKTQDKVKEQVDAIKRNLTEQHAKEVEKLSKANESLESQLQQHLVQSAAAMALGKHKGDPDLLMPHISQTVRAVKGEDGKYAIRVLSADGHEELSKASGKAAEPMPVDEYVGTVLKTRFPAAFEGSGATGSGATGSSRGGSGAGRFTISDEQARNDPQAYQRVRAEAEKAGATVTIVE